MAPNVVAPFLIMFTAFIAQAILLEAPLTSLGLGVTEPTPAEAPCSPAMPPTSIGKRPG